jgi:hypothetical protein
MAIDARHNHIPTLFTLAQPHIAMGNRRRSTYLCARILLTPSINEYPSIMDAVKDHLNKGYKHPLNQYYIKLILSRENQPPLTNVDQFLLTSPNVFQPENCEFDTATIKKQIAYGAKETLDIDTKGELELKLPAESEEELDRILPPLRFP